MTTLYAQPYDLAATGFYFSAADEFAARATLLRNAYGQPVEEFEIQFIDGERIDAELFEALSVSQTDIGAYLEVVAEWDDRQKIIVIIATGELGYRFRLGQDDPEQFDIDLYQIDSMRELAMQFVDDGLFGDIPKAIENYLDYDAIARDLGMDYAEVRVAGHRYIYRSG